MKLSDNFTLQEFTRSETAMREGISEQYNPPQSVINNLKRLAVEIAEPIRSKFGGFAPTCAYRCPKVNTIIGSSSTSMHVTGEAFDETFMKDNKNISAEVFYWLVNNKQLPYTELIWEKGDINQPAWVHVGIKKSKPQTIMVFDGKSYINYYQSKHYEKHKELGYVK